MVHKFGHNWCASPDLWMSSGGACYDYNTGHNIDMGHWYTDGTYREIISIVTGATTPWVLGHLVTSSTFRDPRQPNSNFLSPIFWHNNLFHISIPTSVFLSSTFWLLCHKLLVYFDVISLSHNLSILEKSRGRTGNRTRDFMISRQVHYHWPSSRVVSN